MKFGIFYEHQLPKPWEEHSEYQLIQNSLAQIELADQLGYDYAWEVEHHFLEEYIFILGIQHLLKQHKQLLVCHQGHMLV